PLPLARVHRGLSGDAGPLAALHPLLRHRAARALLRARGGDPGARVELRSLRSGGAPGGAAGDPGGPGRGRRRAGDVPGGGAAAGAPPPTPRAGGAGGQALRLVPPPQALRTALPAMTNDLIALLKDSSLVSVITVVELTKQMTITAVDVRGWLFPRLLCAGFYFAMSYPLSVWARRFEKRLAHA